MHELIITILKRRQGLGLLVKGVWQDEWYDTKSHAGAFEREAAQLRNWITVDGRAGPTGQSGFKAESGRYHLYVSLACPWAHRTLIFREIMGLKDHISLSIVSPDMLSDGWTFDLDKWSTGDDLYHCDFLHQIYTKNKADYSGRVTVPVMWDKKSECIVSNESSEIIRMLNSAFNPITGNQIDFYPEKLKSQIDRVNNSVYKCINNGVYRCGFATTQSAYDSAFNLLFDELEQIEEKLTNQPYLLGADLTEADWRLFTTLIRFDSVYFGHFKCNKKQIADYPALAKYLRHLYHWPGIKETVDFFHIKRHYYFSHTMINPTQVVPKGPVLEYLI